MLKKIIIFVFALILLFVTPVSTVFASAKSSSDEFDTVILLDVSGSMSVSLGEVKTSALDFCSNILSANAGNRIAVVAYDTNANEACPLTSDYNTLETAINNLSDAGTTNMIDACELAYSILTAENAKGRTKNVIIMSDGYPCAGEYLTDGHYNSLYPDCDVEYQNKVYDFVTTNLHPIASVYTVGFYEGIDAEHPENYDSEVQMTIQFMKDLSNTTTYFPTTAGNVFGDIAEDMLEENNNTSSSGSGTGTTVAVISVGATGCTAGIIALIIYLATRKPTASAAAPVMAPVFLPVISDDDDDDNNKNRNYNMPPEGIEKFAAEAGAVRNNGYFVVPDICTAKVYGVSGTYRNFDFDAKDGDVVRLGRDPQYSNLVITEDNSKVSRTHCTITYNNARNCFVVTDMSRNGTYTKTNRLPHNIPTDVPCGTEIQLADSTNIFRLG